MFLRLSSSKLKLNLNQMKITFYNLKFLKTLNNEKKLKENPKKKYSEENIQKISKRKVEEKEEHKWILLKLIIMKKNIWVLIKCR